METKLTEIRDWLFNEWSAKLCMVFESMAGEQPAIEPAKPRDPAAAPEAGAIVWNQSFVVLDEPSIWIATS